MEDRAGAAAPPFPAPLTCEPGQLIHAGNATVAPTQIA